MKIGTGRIEAFGLFPADDTGILVEIGSKALRTGKLGKLSCIEKVWHLSTSTIMHIRPSLLVLLLEEVGVRSSEGPLRPAPREGLIDGELQCRVGDLRNFRV
jgi:hypothetical protein